MALSSTGQCFLTLLLLFTLQTHARESRFFSKVSRAETEPENISPSSSPSTATEAKTEQGYGLFGKEETYEYSPTTTNPTKSETQKFKYVEPNGVKAADSGYRYGAGEKQGMSDTRFLEGGKYYHDINSEKELVANNGKLMEEDDGHESYYGHGYENGGQFKEERYETVDNGKYYKTNKYGNAEEEEEEEEDKYGRTGERQGMSGRYHYDINSEDPNGVESYEKAKKNDEDNYGIQAYRTGGRQGMSDTRFLENGKYYYDINNEDPNVVESYQRAKKNDKYYNEESYKGESYDSNYEKENEKSSGYDFRRTPNKFPRYEFDSMEEYEKYEQGRSHQTEYAP